MRPSLVKNVQRPVNGPHTTSRRWPVDLFSRRPSVVRIEWWYGGTAITNDITWFCLSQRDDGDPWSRAAANSPRFPLVLWCSGGPVKMVATMEAGPRLFQIYQAITLAGTKRRLLYTLRFFRPPAAAAAFQKGVVYFLQSCTPWIISCCRVMHRVHCGRHSERDRVPTMAAVLPQGHAGHSGVHTGILSRLYHLCAVPRTIQL